MPELFVASHSSRGWSDHTSLASELLVIETPAGRLENRCEILKDTLCLGHDTSLDHLARGRVLADLTAAVEETTDFNRLGKRADRWRKLGRGDCGPAHGKLLLILG